VVLAGLTGEVDCKRATGGGDQSLSFPAAGAAATEVDDAVTKANGDQMKAHLAARLMRGFAGYDLVCYKAEKTGDGKLQIIVRVTAADKVCPESLPEYGWDLRPGLPAHTHARNLDKPSRITPTVPGPGGAGH
jgi:hypothetical protein